MKHSTFYMTEKGLRVYTTIKDTPYHAFLRKKGNTSSKCYNGITYKHKDNEVLYFIYPSIPLIAPLHYEEIIE